MKMLQTWMGFIMDYNKKIRNHLRTADFVPCPAHSLDLVGNVTVGSFLEAVSFFGLIQKCILSFPHLLSAGKFWKTVVTRVALALRWKSCETRWFAWADAVKAFRRSYGQIKEALVEIEEDTNQKNYAKHEAANLAKKFENFDIWDDVMCRINETSKSVLRESERFTLDGRSYTTRWSTF